MQRRRLGSQGLEVSALGLGCMGMSWAYGGGRDDAASIAVIHAALDAGVNFLDTAEVYGPFTNEVLVGQAIRDRRDRVIVATKFGFIYDAQGRTIGANSQPAHVRQVVNASLTRLGVDHIDLLYQHRVDPNVPIEEVVGVMSEFVQAGKVKYIGLSEAGPGTIRKAHVIHPISAVQSEYSLFEREVEADVLPVCRELGIGFVPYSPLGRGLLTGKVKSAAEYAAEGDNRGNFPRFQEEHFARNLALVEAIRTRATEKKITPGQFAIAWLLDRGPDIVPIPGTKRRAYLDENLAAVDVKFTEDDRAWLEKHVSVNDVGGARYAPAAMQLIDRT